MKKYILYAVMLLALGSLTGCQKTEGAPELLEPVGVEMDTAEAVIGDIYAMSVYSGEIVPYVEEVSFAVDGKLAEFKVSVGEEVTEGQLLARLDDEELLEQIEELEEELEEIMVSGSFSDRIMAADIEIAIENLEIQQERKASDAAIRAKELEIEMLELELQENQELREMELDRLNKQVQELKAELAKTELKAPISGRVVYLSEAGAGDSIKTTVPVICIADETQLTISAEYIAPSYIKGASRITAQILGEEYEVVYEPYSDTEYVTLVLSGEKLDTRFSLADETAAVESGQYVVIKLWSAYKEKVLTIPVNALYRDDKGRYVYKIVDGQRVRCDVTVGMSNSVEAEILEGLEEGDVVYVKE